MSRTFLVLIQCQLACSTILQQQQQSEYIGPVLDDGEVLFSDEEIRRQDQERLVATEETAFKDETHHAAEVLLAYKKKYREEQGVRDAEMALAKARALKRLAAEQEASEEKHEEEQAESYNEKLKEEQDRLLKLAVALRKEAEANTSDTPFAKPFPMFDQVASLSGLDLAEVLGSAASAMAYQAFDEGVKATTQEWQRKTANKVMLFKSFLNDFTSSASSAHNAKDITMALAPLLNKTADIFLNNQDDAILLVKAIQALAPPALQKSLAPLVTTLEKPIDFGEGILDTGELASMEEQQVCKNLNLLAKGWAPALHKVKAAQQAVTSAAEVIPLLGDVIPDQPKEMKGVMQRVLNVAFMQTIMVDDIAGQLVKEVGHFYDGQLECSPPGSNTWLSYRKSGSKDDRSERSGSLRVLASSGVLAVGLMAAFTTGGSLG